MEEALSAAAVAAETMPQPGLTKTDREILDFEAVPWTYAGAKESAIRRQFGFSATTFYRRLLWLLDQPEALAYDPMLVKRLQRLRGARRGARSASA